MGQLPVWRLGLGGSDHDFSAALACGTDIRVAIEQERITRVKNGATVWYKEPMAPAVDYCLSAEERSIDDVAVVAASDTIPARTRATFADKDLRLFSHHQCHAASAYMMMPSGSKAAIIVYDGYGSIIEANTGPGRARRETISFHLFSDKGPECLGTTSGLSYREQDDFPIAISNSVGMLYEIATMVLGYGSTDSGKTMGLAAHGKPQHTQRLLSFVTLGESLSDCFRCPTDGGEVAACMEHILHNGAGSFATRADLASSVQNVVETVLLHCAALMGPRDVDYIGISGGCGLNTVANSKLVEGLQPTVPIVIPPHCGDAGLGLGALWLCAWQDGGRLPDMTFRGSSLARGLSRPGRCYSEDSVRSAVDDFYPRLSFDPSINSPDSVASLIASGSIIGLFNGRSEIGPRALGGRSILADPRAIAVRERLNRRIKNREPFRPLGPVILADSYDEYFFDRWNADPFMLKVSRVRERCCREAPAAVHIDGTARVQSLHPDYDPFLASVLDAFRKQTGVPMLLNTSFNRRGEPIVETPTDAIDAFLGMGLDGLLLEGRYYRAAEVHPGA
jgi:carbamoyltransferase